MRIGTWSSIGKMMISNYNRHTQTMNQSMLRLSTGYRINSAADDAAGLAISEKMRAQIRGLTMAGKNIQDGIALVQTADVTLSETHVMLQQAESILRLLDVR